MSDASLESCATVAMDVMQQNKSPSQHDEQGDELPKQWQKVKLARHAKRPLFLDYVNQLFTEFDELHGDRAFKDDRALIGGLARFEHQPVVVLGHHRGRSTRERIAHNFGMANPEGYRKAMRLAKMAERFGLPLFTFIDTQGAYPGVEAEERGQAYVIAESLATFSRLKTPIIVTVIGEGGSGGALAIGVGDRVNMLVNSIYSVISPEGCASILWKTADKAPQASEALKLGADDLFAMGLIDTVIDEGEGAHLSSSVVMTNLQAVLRRQLNELMATQNTQLVANRYERLKQFDATVCL